MLGFYAFSRAPLSSLANVAFFVSATENVSVTDVRVVTKGYTDSLTENLRPASVESATAAFLSSRSENVTVDTSVTAGIAFTVSNTEGFIPTDIIAISTQFATAVSENLLPDSYSVEGEAYFASISEGAILDNSSAETEGYVFTQIEDIVAADSSSVTAQYITAIVENAAVLSVQHITAQFLTIINENTGEASVEGITAGFAAQPLEALTVQDEVSYFHYPVSVGWTPINTDIYTYGSGSLMFGGATFAQIPFSGYTGDSSVVIPAWTEGSYCSSTITNVVWGDINNNAYGTATPAGIMFGGTAFSTIAISGFSGTDTIVGPGWKDIVNN